jgi:hypothetical protein
LGDRSEGPAQTLKGAPSKPNFIIGYDPVGAFLGGWGFDLIAWRGVDNATLDSPVAETREHGENPIGDDRRAAVDDLVK